MLMNLWASRSQGFTIVELLIVIVVIAILAAISIVAYNGIQTRTENTKTVQAVSQYIKLIKSFSAINSVYPSDPAYPCLGTAGTNCARVSGSTTCATSGDGLAGTTANFTNQINQVLSGSEPQLSSQQITGCTSNLYSGGYYRSTDGRNAYIVYYLRGDATCSANAGSIGRSQGGDMTRCQTNFPVI